ncbi:MAG: hypothetical protein MZV64_19065 [Ignavibacteriales bacterium]|nr:hypothetical protein [Ignavibacteriales bacterium]
MDKLRPARSRMQARMLSNSTCTIIPTDLDLTVRRTSKIAQVELVAEVKVCHQASRWRSSSAHSSPPCPTLPKRLVEAGADGLVLFNRFYQPDFDLDELEIVHSLDLSTSAELRLPLRWISILHGKVNADFALTSGVHTAQGCDQDHDGGREGGDDGVEPAP